MKILINTPELDLPGGVAYYYKTIKPYFKSEVSYFTIGKREKNHSKLASVLQMAKDYYFFLIEINTKKYDIIHINPSLGAISFIRDSIFIGLAKLSRKKVIVFFRGWDQDYEVFSKKYLLWLYKVTYFRAEAIIVLAEQFKNKLSSFGYIGKMYVESTVVGDEVFSGFNPEERKYANDVINILFLSRIEKAKGIYELIDSVKTLNLKYNNIFLIVAGSGDEKKAVEKYAYNSNVSNVIFTGHITGKEKQRAFQQADIFAFPTYYGEGMPNAVLEAMAYGLPVITRPVGGLSDFFEHKKMGFLINEIDSDVYASRLDVLIKDNELRSKISQYNRKYSDKNFKASNVVKRLEQIYSEVVE